MRPGFLDKRCEIMLFGLGAQKTGTTWVANYLGLHPDTGPRWHGERHYFTRLFWNRANGGGRKTTWPIEADFKSTARAVRRRHVARIDFLTGRARYTRQVSGGPKPVKLGFDITPAYGALGPEAYDTMYKSHRNTRFLFVMRDPVERQWSAARMYAKHALRDGEADELSPALEKSAMDILEIPRKVLRSDYQGTIEALESVVPRERIKYMFFEQLFTEDSLRDLSEFLGIDYIAQELDPINVGKKVAMPEEWRRKALELFAPTYRFVFDRFGSDVPDSWTRDWEKVAA